jgi:pyruvate formate lyase activating enzyme
MKPSPPLKGFLPVTLLDWPGKIAAMIFFGGCNFRCQFCYNTELVLHPETLPNIPEEKIFSFLLKKKNWLDGVVLSGGEPTLYPDLPLFCQKIKKHGFAIQIQTNGTNPQMLQKLLEEKLIDFIAMDIKGPLSKYPQITQTKINPEMIRRSIELIAQYPQIEAEFRTTLVPSLITKDDLPEMIALLKKTKRPYFLQQLRPEKTLNNKIQKETPYSRKELETLLKIAQKHYPQTKLRGI